MTRRKESEIHAPVFEFYYLVDSVELLKSMEDDKTAEPVSDALSEQKLVRDSVDRARSLARACVSNRSVCR